MERAPLDVPAAPGYRVPWDDLQAFPWVRALEGCPQDPVHHAEGNVWIHTRMVLETLVAMPEWRGLGERERRVVYLACLLHDVAKPFTTREEDGRITAKGHSRKGAILARRLLWERGLDFHEREEICALVASHQLPFFLIERAPEEARRRAAAISLSARCDLLALVAEADIRGRVCADLQRILDHIELFRELCREERCYEGPRPFPSAATRLAYLRGERESPDVEVWDEPRVEVVLMSGLPGSGKDTYAQGALRGWPAVSLDGLREELDVDPEDAQGSVVQAARERARAHLRRGERFVWNATNLARRTRDGLVRLFTDYRARVTLAYVEAPAERLFAQNEARRARVPARVIHAMMERWEVPERSEAHEVRYAVGGAVVSAPCRATP